MADAMVTARMSQEKKQEAALILEELGLSASQAINQLYDYLIHYKRLPFGEKRHLRDGCEISPEEWRAAKAWADDFPYVSLDAEFLAMTAKDARLHRLRSRGDFDELGESHEIAS